MTSSTINVKQKGPFKVTLEANKKYSWCSCGFSNKIPFCDGSHREKSPDKRSLKVFPGKTEIKYLCGCQKTKSPPYCDGSHKDLN